MNEQHARYMRRCLELAEKGKGLVAPNPMVGAVLVHNDTIIGEGWHRQYGAAHAEVACLENVPAAQRHLIPESTMYVSLEPCAHWGKTPPCALRLAEEKVRQVIICNDDPFEGVKGKGFQILQANNITIASGLLREEGLWLNRRFFCFHQQKRPYIVLKWAQTKQGFFAPLNRSRFQMSNRYSQQLVHRWRTEETAILVGYRTALHDDPQLTARLWEGRQPLRLVLDRHLKLPSSLRIMNSDAPTWVIVEVNESNEANEGRGEEGAGVSYLKLPFSEELLPQLMKELHRAGKLSLIVEGGAHLLNSFIQQDLWDEARIFITPGTLQDGIPAPLLTHAQEAFSTPVGSDTLHVYTHQQTPYPYIKGMPL